MSLGNLIHWSEGLFLRPHHFQQQDRYHHQALVKYFKFLSSNHYGFLKLKLDSELLKIGKLGLVAVTGIFQDGTLFDFPEDGKLPLPIVIPDGTKETFVHFTIPVNRSGVANVMETDSLLENTQSSMARYTIAEQDIHDYQIGRDNSTPVKVLQLNTTLQLETELSSAFVSIAVAKIIEKRADGQVVLDENFIPACIDINASNRLKDIAQEVYGLLKHRATVIASRVSSPGSSGVAEFADFLLLQACNRAEALFSHLVNAPLLHPEKLYIEMVMLAGELSTFGNKDRRCPEFPPYKQSLMRDSFDPVLKEIRRTLTAILEQSAISIPLQDKGRGVYFAEIQDATLVRHGAFVLAVFANVTSEQVRAGFPPQLKIGPTDKIRDLVMSHLPGIIIRPLPVAPRQIPYHSGYVYFELDRTSELWKGVELAKSLAMHVAGEFAGLKLELWAIREK